MPLWETERSSSREGRHRDQSTARAHQPRAHQRPLDLSQNDFWARPPAERCAAFARLRALDRAAVLRGAASRRSVPPERGYYALVRHADVAEASRNPEVFSSAAGATSIIDLPAEFNEYFGSMINMDDPRHARLRRIVSRAFTPRMIKKFEEDVQRTAAGIVDELLADRARATSCSTWPRGFRSRSSAR